MVKVNYKYILHGEKFTFEGQEYSKTSHSRGYYYEDGKTIHRNFKQLTIVETDASCYEDVPKLK